MQESHRKAFERGFTEFNVFNEICKNVYAIKAKGTYTSDKTLEFLDDDLNEEFKACLEEMRNPAVFFLKDDKKQLMEGHVDIDFEMDGVYFCIEYSLKEQTVQVIEIDDNDEWNYLTDYDLTIQFPEQKEKLDTIANHLKTFVEQYKKFRLSLLFEKKEPF